MRKVLLGVAAITTMTAVLFIGEIALSKAIYRIAIRKSSKDHEKYE